MKINKSYHWVLLMVLAIIGLQTANAQGIKDATWYLTMDVEELLNNQLINALKGQELKEKIPEQVTSITVYGDATGSENATVVLTGDFSNFSVAEHLLDLIEHEDGGDHHVEESYITHNQQRITVLSVKDDDHQEFKKGYFAEIDANKSVASLQLSEVKNWIDHVYDELEINKGSLFSVVVDIESALAHMGMNLDDNAHMMHSQIFKKVDQISASLSETDNNLILEVGLTANDEASASLIVQVINGLIAMNNLSNANERNEIHALFMQNLSIEKNGNDVLLTTYLPMNEINHMELYKHLNIKQKDGYKIKKLKSH